MRADTHGSIGVHDGSHSLRARPIPRHPSSAPLQADPAPPCPDGPATESADGAPALRTIFFIHIEKTGGTSFRESAIEQFSADRVVTLYGKHSRTTSGPVAAIFKQRAATRQQRLAKLSQYLSAGGIRFFASHIPDYWKLDGFDPSFAVTILRSPAERTLSNYFFDRRMGRLQDLTFPAYFRDPQNQNVQAKRFRAVPLSKLGLVGITEEYEAFVQAFNRKFGLDFAVRHEKRGSLPYRIRSALLLRRHRREIKSLNREDCECYAEARALWAQHKAGA